MFKLWAKIFKDTRLIKDMTVENDTTLNRTRKVYDAIDKVCVEFNIGHPLWLDVNIREFKMFDKTRFTSDSFIDKIDFDYLEIHVIEED